MTTKTTLTDILVTVIATITAYTFQPHTPYHTATGYRQVPGKTCAVSQDLLHLLKKEIYIEGLGYFFANDTMPEQWERRIDILHESHEEAKKFGVKNDRRVFQAVP